MDSERDDLKLWKCPSRLTLRALEASKKSFKMMPYGWSVSWHVIQGDVQTGTKVLTLSTVENDQYLNLYFIKGKDSIHNTIVANKNLFWGKKK